MSGYLVQLASARCRGGVLTARLLLPFVKPGLTKQLTSPYKKIKNVTGQSAFHRRFECHVTLQKVRRRIKFASRHQTYETEYAHPQTEKKGKKRKQKKEGKPTIEFQNFKLICIGHWASTGTHHLAAESGTNSLTDSFQTISSHSRERWSASHH